MKRNIDKFVIGLDFGTDSVRCVIIDTLKGNELASCVSYYPRWSKGLYCNTNIKQFRQHPLDYLETLTYSIKTSLIKLSDRVKRNISGIGVGTTGSTLAPVDKNGVVLSLKSEFRENPNAMFIIWKDLTATKEAEYINSVLKDSKVNYAKYEGGIYSAEWFWAKILYISNVDNKVKDSMFSWLELADWIPAILTDNLNLKNLKRSRCAASLKAMWHDDWGGLPPERFLNKVSPLLGKLRRNLYDKTYTSDTCAGLLSKEWGDKLGIPYGIPVAVGAFDDIMGAVGAGAESGILIKEVGTSCSDVLLVSKENLRNRIIPGICGQVDGIISPHTVCLEAGQSAFGDIFAWFRNILTYTLKNNNSKLLDKMNQQKIDKLIFNKLASDADKIDILKSTAFAIDWFNGRRSPDVNEKLQGAILGLTLGTSAPEIFRALIESACFGSKAVFDRFIKNGISIRKIIATGGIPKKSPLVVQILSDVLNKPILTLKTDKVEALGAAIYGAVISGIYKNVESAQKRMSAEIDKIYYPNIENKKIYERFYSKYKNIGILLENNLFT